MLFTSNRILLLVSLLTACTLWLAVSSVVANAVHIFAKENFSWNTFGYVSFSLILINLVFLIFISYVLALNTPHTLKRQCCSFFAVAMWCGFLLILTVLLDKWLVEFIVAGIFVWLIEIVAAVSLLKCFVPQSFLSFSL